MMKRTVGIVLALLGCVLIPLFIVKGLVVPHLVGPGLLLTIGLVLIFTGPKAKLDH